MNMRFLKDSEDWAKWVNENSLIVGVPKEFPCHAYTTLEGEEWDQPPAPEAHYLYKKDIEQMLIQIQPASALKTGYWYVKITPGADYPEVVEVKQKEEKL